MTPLKKWLRRLRTLVWTAAALIIIGAAVLVGIGKLLMPYSDRFKPRLEAVLAEQFNQPVRLDAFTGEWKAFGPRISLEGVQLLGGPAGEGAMAIQRAALDIKPLNALIADRPLYTFRIIGADLVLLRLADGQFELSGLGLSGRRLGGEDPAERSSGLSNLARVGEVRLEDSRFAYRDPALEIDLQLQGIEGRLQMGGDRLAAEVQASLVDAQRGIVLGDLSVTAKSRLDEARQFETVEFHLESGEVMLDELALQLPDHPLKPVSGRVNAQLWGQWAPGDPLALAGVVDLRDAGLDTGQQALQLERLNARMKLRWHDKTRWRIDLADARVIENDREWLAPRITVERHLAGNIASWVSADYLEAEFPVEAVQVFMKELGYRWPKAAPTAGRGPIRDFDLVINGNRKLAATSGTFEDLDVMAWGPWPLPHGLSGRADLAYGEGSLYITGEAVEIHWDRNFRRPLVADLGDCEIEVLWDDTDYWQVDALPCPLSSAPFAAEARLRFLKDEGRPRVDVIADIQRGDLVALRDYWPESIMSPKVSDWMRRSISAGTLTGGRLLLQGDMDRFPFADGVGTLLADAQLRDVRLDYAPAWPAADGIDATLKFDGPSLSVSGGIADLAGATVQAASARIDDLKSPVLMLSYDSESTLPEVEAFIAASPLLRDSDLTLDAFEFAGAARTRGTLRIPFGTGRGEVDVTGVLDVQGGRFVEERSGLVLEGLEGRIEYDRAGARGEGLAVTLEGWPGVLALDAAWGTPQPFAATLAGRFPAEMLIRQTPLADDPLLGRIEGETDWRLAVTVDKPVDPPAGGGKTEAWLELESDLVDVALSLPAPLTKTPEERWPLTLRYPLIGDDRVFRASLERRLAIALELSEVAGQTPDVLVEPGIDGVEAPVSDAPALSAEPGGESLVPTPSSPPGALPALKRGAVAFGGVPANLPETGRFAIGGHAQRLDLDDWVSVIVDYARSGVAAGGLTLESTELFAEELLLLNRRFDEVNINFGYANAQLDASLQGATIAGDLRYQQNDDGTQSLAAQFERLWMPPPEDDGVSMETDPRLLPEMRFFVQDFEYLGLDLGQTRIEAYPIANGLRIETVEAASDQLSFEARGDWVVTDDGSRSDFDIVMTSESLGGIVNALDLSAVLEGGQTMVRYDAWWPGPPAAFELARLNGQMSFSVVDGRVLNADPGAGRVLGLMSLGALPRRLALDFSDVFASGFGFDQASGTIRLDSGVAFTDDFVIESTAAQLSIAGSSDLEAKEFDYEMAVRPGVSQALPMIGAIAAGPAGVAAGIALQELLREALGEAAEARYEIRGPWSEPEVTRIDSSPRLAPEALPESAPEPEPSTATAQTREGT